MADPEELTPGAHLIEVFQGTLRARGASLDMDDVWHCQDYHEIKADAIQCAADELIVRQFRSEYGRRIARDNPVVSPGLRFLLACDEAFWLTEQDLKDLQPPHVIDSICARIYQVYVLGTQEEHEPGRD